MAIPKISKKDVLSAMEFIDKNGTPDDYQSIEYDLVSKEGKRYSPKYVVAVANSLANNAEISTKEFNSQEARNFLTKNGFSIKEKEAVPGKFQLTITAKDVVSTDERFTMDNLFLGDNYKPLDAYFQHGDDIIKRKRNKGEKVISNQTLPRLACQVFEKQIAALPKEEKENFPVCKYVPETDYIRGIFSSVEENLKHRKSLEYVVYTYGEGRQFVFYCWNIFSTIIFVQECLKRFGPNDKFVLKYREKVKNEDSIAKEELDLHEELVKQNQEYMNDFSPILIEAKNVIFHGAPGTGKTYLAKQIATDIISKGLFTDYEMLSDEQKKQIEFVQFHPSYDYTDFVEGLRPKQNLDASLGFELQDGIFKKFVTRARENYENSQKSAQDVAKEKSNQELMKQFFSNLELGVDKFYTVSGNEFSIINVDENFIDIFIPGNPSYKNVHLNKKDLVEMLKANQTFTKVKDITNFFNKDFNTQEFSYDFAIYKAIMALKKTGAQKDAAPEELKKYIFIIDEINRGEISKIFGELFFSIDPGYRGKRGEVSTQYSSMHKDPNEKFYVPENVYIIGTMNDIDRSVDNFDFAMRRRFRFIELKADEMIEMLSNLPTEELKDEAIRRMAALNKEIAQVEGLNENYQIGASYFSKIKKREDFDTLWTDYLQPLLQDYVHGIYDEQGVMKKFARAYGFNQPEGSADENNQD